MEYIYFNDNPLDKNVGDCVIRAISKVLDMTWDDVFWDLATYGHRMADMPSSNAVWSQYLIENGFRRQVIPNTCPDCYTVRAFACDNPSGRFVLATGTHAVAVIDGIVYDSWNSLNEIPIYYFWRK